MKNKQLDKTKRKRGEEGKEEGERIEAHINRINTTHDVTLVTQWMIPSPRLLNDVIEFKVAQSNAESEHRFVTVSELLLFSFSFFFLSQYFHSLFVILLFRFDAIEIKLTICLSHDLAMFFRRFLKNERAKEENTTYDNCRQTIVWIAKERERESATITKCCVKLHLTSRAGRTTNRWNTFSRIWPMISAFVLLSISIFPYLHDYWHGINIYAHTHTHTISFFSSSLLCFQLSCLEHTHIFFASLS